MEQLAEKLRQAVALDPNQTDIPSSNRDDETAQEANVPPESEAQWRPNFEQIMRDIVALEAVRDAVKPGAACCSMQQLMAVFDRHSTNAFPQNVERRKCRLERWLISRGRHSRQNN
jgi:hypothetical protein